MIIINGVPIDPSIYSGDENEGQETKTVRKEFRALNLYLSNLIADITIEPGASNKIEVELTATQSVTNCIQFECSNDDVRISGKNSNPRAQNNMKICNVIRGGKMSSFMGDGALVIQDGNIISCNGDIHISDKSNGSRKAKLTIKAPCGHTIGVNGVIGDVYIGKLDCDLEADIDGAGTIQAQSVGDLSVDVSGSGNIWVGEISGDADCDISGSGRIDISSGRIDKLKAGVSGCGRIDVMATAKTAKLSVSGVGNIHVKHVINHPKENRSGMGSIRVDSVG